MPSEANSRSPGKAIEPTATHISAGGNRPAARLIVCEQSGAWAAMLRRESPGVELPVYETRNIATCWDALGVAPASLLVVELASGMVEDLLRRMVRLPRDFPRARIVVVAPRELAKYEWLLREAGAVFFTCSARWTGTLAALARRHLAQAPLPQRSFSEQVWEGLPWATR